jgi:hypothetical protein
MRTTSRRRVAGATLATALIVATAVSGRAATDAARFRAVAVNFNAPPGDPPASALEIVVHRWSTQAERDRLLASLENGGQAGLLDAIQDAPRVGYVRVPGSLATRLHHAWRETDAEGTTRIMLVTDRPVGFAEAVDRPLSFEYRFAVVELEVDGDGNGRGTIALAAKLLKGRDEGTMRVKGWTQQPVFLNNVTRVGP